MHFRARLTGYLVTQNAPITQVLSKMAKRVMTCDSSGSGYVSLIDVADMSDDGRSTESYGNLHR